MSYNNNSSAYLDHQKTYDDLPLREKISLSFVSQGISLAISGQETTAGIASTFAGTEWIGI